ncbi:YfhO family protein [Geomonas agri]|uniref:YfhO family protein n=1 Tax=Geomonas agri TaxID=2873702 RepID=UPI001CD7E7F3|nr:YfhO family protein [Geomonas agri]
MSRRNFLIWITAVAVGAVTPALVVLATGHTLVWRDSSKLFQPIRPLVVDALRNLQLPLWNPYEVLGIPLFAQLMHGVLHPVSVIGAFLFPQAGLDVFITIYIMLAAIGGALLARLLGVSYGAAALAGLGFGLSGYVLGLSSNTQYLCAAATAPWCIAAIRGAGDERRFGVVIAAAATAAMHLAGDPQWTIVALLLGTALALEGGAGRGFRRALTGIAVGTALSGLQLVPTLLFLRETTRGVDLDLFDRLQWALPPWRILEFIAPGFFGSPGQGVTKWPVFMWLGGLARPGLEMPFLPSVHMGACMLLLALAGVAHSRITRILGVSTLIALWLALGTSLGAEQLTHLMPVWGKFRYAEKMVGPLTLCLSLLAAFGAERIAQRPSKLCLLFAAGVGFACLGLALLLPNWQGLETLLTGTAANGAAPQAIRNLARGLVHAGVPLLALACLIAAAGHWAATRSLFPAAAAGLVFAQGLFSAHYALHAGTRSVLDPLPLQKVAISGEPTRIVTPFEENYNYQMGIDEFDAQTGGQSHMGAPSYNVASHIDQINTYTGLRPRRFDLLIATLNRQFGIQALTALRRYALTHVIIKNPHSDNEAEVARAASTGGNKVLENPDWDFAGWQVPHRPWAMFAEQVTLVPGEKEALEALTGILERGGASVVLEGASPAGALGAGSVLASTRLSNHLRIEAVSKEDGILVVNDSYWPGWRAKIDGRDVPIWRADYAVRAVPWPAGKHVLEMNYEPREVRIGLLISVAGGIALISLAVVEWRRLRVTAP